VRRPFCLLAGAAAAVVAGAALTACNSAPYAATVNGTEISQTALNQEIAYGDQSRAYMDLVQTIQTQATGNRVVPTGAGSGTHTIAWADLELDNLVQAAVIHAAVVADGERPGAAMLDAARGVLEAEMSPAGFAQVPVAYRDDLVRRLAEHAELEQPGADAAQLQQVYSHYLADFYSQVCVRQISIAVGRGQQRLDPATGLALASEIGVKYDAGGYSLATLPGAIGRGVSGGGLTCYSQAALEARGGRFMTTVMGLAPGRASAPLRTSAGYDVVAVVSRDTEPFGGPVARALEAAILEREPFIDSAVVTLEERAHVDVEPSYGRWDSGATDGTIPGIVAVPVPAAAPGSPAGTVPSYDPFSPSASSAPSS
jgi:hypothetical protein